MSSTQIFEPGFGNSRQRSRWYPVPGGWETTVAHKDDDVKATWSLIDLVDSGETVSSAAYSDSGATSSSKSVSTPTVIFTLTGIGHTEVTATLSTGRTVTRRFYIALEDGIARRSDYGQ